MQQQESFTGNQGPGAKSAAGSSGPSRGKEFQDLIKELTRLDRVRGGLLVAPDGFVIASELPQGLPVEPLAALTATLGRELEVGAARLKRGPFLTALFSSDDGTLFLGGSPVGFLVVLGDREVNVGTIRVALRKAIDTIQSAWRS